MAISILMVAVVAPITIAQKGLSSATYSKSQMIASYLAQDAIEYIINKRDEVSLRNGYKWDALWGISYLESCRVETLVDLTNNNEKGCQIDTNIGNGDGQTEAYSASSFLKKEGSFYGFSGNTVTNFSRQVKIMIDPNENNSDEALIRVTVSWGGDVNNKVTVNTLIYNY